MRHSNHQAGGLTSEAAVQKLSTQMAGKIQIVKIDTDKYPKVASRYAIQVNACHHTRSPATAL